MVFNYALNPLVRYNLCPVVAFALAGGGGGGALWPPSRITEASEEECSESDMMTESPSLAMLMDDDYDLLSLSRRLFGYRKC
jgi:hypothetical protein